MSAFPATYLSLLRLASQANAQIFVAQSPPHVLVLDGAADAAGVSNFQTSVGSGGAGFLPGDPKVLVIQKREGANAFSSMVTVGRAPNNDMVIEHQSVSKFHAYFTWRETELCVVDAGATNATKVEGVELERDAPCAIRAGTRIKLGDVEATYYDASALFKHLREGLDEDA